jgi:hypothetical protein
MTSPRYAWAAAALLALALVPTVANVYVPHEPPRRGALDADLPRELPGFGAAQPGRRAEDPDWVAEAFGTEDYVSRRHGDLELFAARTEHARRLFHGPENALSYGHAAAAERTATVETAAGPLPVRVLEFAPEGESVHTAVYALLCGKEPVARPYHHRLGELPALLLGRRTPWTLVYVTGDAAPDAQDDLARRLQGLLAAACAELRR